MRCLYFTLFFCLTLSHYPLFAQQQQRVAIFKNNTAFFIQEVQIDASKKRGLNENLIKGLQKEISIFKITIGSLDRFYINGTKPKVDI